MNVLDLKKYFNNQALEVFQKHYQLDTGFIHFDDNKPFEKSSSKVSIPLSFLYVLSLFKTHKQENILEAIKLLKKLLYFQSSEKGFEGCFPKYLHEYPFAYDKTSLLDIAMVLKILIKSYKAILEESVLEKIEKSFNKLLNYLNTQEFKVKALELRLRAFSESVFEEVLGFLNEKSLTASDLSELVLASESFSLEQREKFYQKALNFYHPLTRAYRGLHPEKNSYFGLYEKSLFEGFFSHFFQKEESNFSNFSDKTLMRLTLTTPLKKDPFYDELVSEKKYSFNFLESFDSSKHPAHSYLFHLQFLSEKDICSLLCLDSPLEFNSRCNEKYYEAFFTYPKEVPEDGPNQVELNFFMSDLPGSHLFVEGVKATIFYLDNTLRFQVGRHFVDFRWTVEEGEARLIGQISKGNRPSDKTPLMGRDFPKAYDWIVSIRTLKRSADVKLKLEMVLSDSLLEDLSSIELENLKRLPLHEGHYQHIK